MADPIATPDDVRGRFHFPRPDESPAGISTEDIRPYLGDAAFDISQAMDIDGLETDLRKRLEWHLAALKILTQHRDLRAYQQRSIGSSSRSYEVKSVDEIKAWIRDHDPSGELLPDDGEEFWYVSVQG